MWRFVISIIAFLQILASSPALPVSAEKVQSYAGKSDMKEENSLLRYEDVDIQLPVKHVAKNGDYLSDIVSFVPLFDLHVERQQDKILIYKGSHLLVARVGQRGALLDGRFVLLHASPELRGEHILLPIKQTMALLQIPCREERGQIVITCSLHLINDLHKAISSIDDTKQRIGFVGILGPERFVVAVRPIIHGTYHGFSGMYELRKEHTWKASKLRMISDTSASVYLEWMPNGTVLENVAVDQRPEFVFVESCSCAGRYHYATMFTVTEMGIQSIWYSSAIFSHVVKNGSRYELVTIKKENIPEKNSGLLPYWIIHETWNGQSFVVTKEEYHDPSKDKR
ncbi:hypothetical protein DNHGIG_29680 [Collibacillus ludicampi]|uniref:Copper amine oxidase-like N-terminal domain-containing protein n=1 Tax=Collibacillus ludicampi TaxID=2771369 RepID=A0AAV4LI76_9BACL|nr:hypothetical protein [Collibacillus ludicampi]GIM47419.1 hypothetical protein DNHGIG_29680 [Collibacillus ludicampi]